MPGHRMRWGLGGAERSLRAALPCVLLLAALGSCSSPVPGPPAESAERLPTTAVVLPNGTRIDAELALTPEQQARGLMYREHLPEDEGMLFVGDRAAPRSFWMYRCRIPLDLIWMDGAHRIVEIVRSAPPCPDSNPRNCPSYGGTVDSVYVLELAAGQADEQGLRVGDRIDF